MKKKIIMMGMLLSLGLFCACSSDEEDVRADNTAKSLNLTISDVSGIMLYNKELQKWYISYYIPNSIDSFNDYYPIELRDEYKVEGLYVIISGKLYEWDIPVYRLGGQKIYYIELTKIEKAE